MSDLREQVLDASAIEQWRAFFARGEVFAVPRETDQLRARLRANTVLLAVTGGLVVLSGMGLIVLSAIGLARAITIVLIIVFAVVVAGVFVRFALVRRRLRGAADSGAEYLRIGAAGLRFGDAVDIPWSSVVGGVGFDHRDAPVHWFHRLAARVSPRAGLEQSELCLGLRGARALRGTAPGRLGKTFTVLGDEGAVRIALDTAVSPDGVRTVLAAAHVAAAMAGVDVLLSNDPAVITQTIVDVTNGRAPRHAG